ncbi:MAG: hypothetical protein FJ088_13900, partial [Deltaproteobacteria bacterium]|nr:hypothetical protein [Deltaproteobacteria bacterium]
MSRNYGFVFFCVFILAAGCSGNKENKEIAADDFDAYSGEEISDEKEVIDQDFFIPPDSDLVCFPNTFKQCSDDFLG